MCEGLSRQAFEEHSGDPSAKYVCLLCQYDLVNSSHSSGQIAMEASLDSSQVTNLVSSSQDGTVLQGGPVAIVDGQTPRSGEVMDGIGGQSATASLVPVAFTAQAVVSVSVPPQVGIMCDSQDTVLYRPETCSGDDSGLAKITEAVDSEPGNMVLGSGSVVVQRLADGKDTPSCSDTQIMLLLTSLVTRLWVPAEWWYNGRQTGKTHCLAVIPQIVIWQLRKLIDLN